MKLRVGYTDITPLDPISLFGREGRQEVFHDVRHCLEASCLLIENVEGLAALVTLDTLYPSARLARAILDALGQYDLCMEEDALMLVASHTHNAPALDDTKPKLGHFEPSYLDFVANKIAACLAALSQETAVISGVRNGQAKCRASVFRRKAVTGLNVTRFRVSKRIVMAPNKSVKIDQTLSLVVFVDDLGRAQSVLWSWPCHAVSEPNSMSVSSDFPGFVRKFIRAEYGNDTLPVFFLPGCSGDIRPASSFAIPIHKKGRWIGIGSRFARRTARTKAALQSALELAIMRGLDGLSDVAPLDRGSLSRTSKVLAISEIRTQGQDSHPVTCADWRIGQIRIRAISAEIASGYNNLNDSAGPLSFLTGCAGQVFGYIPMETHLKEGGYEVTDFAPLFSVPGKFHPRIESKISSLIGV